MTFSALTPGLPSDPLAPSGDVDWAIERHRAVMELALDDRLQGLLAALEGFDVALSETPSAEFVGEDDLELLDEDPESVAEAFVRAESSGLEEMASGATIVLSGTEVKRRIRHKQSIMPSHMAAGLYDDVRALFEIGDREGALISLERLVVVSPLTPQVESFLHHNEGRLLEYYQGVFGPFSRVPALVHSEQRMPASYYALDKIRTITEMVDGRRSIQNILLSSGMSRIEACAVISQLVRAAAIDVGPK